MERRQSRSTDPVFPAAADHGQRPVDNESNSDEPDTSTSPSAGLVIPKLDDPRFPVAAPDDEDHWVVSVEGQLDTAAVSRLSKHLDELATRSPRPFVVDTANVRIVEFTGVEVLMDLFSRLRERGAEVRLRPSDCGAYKVLHRIGSHLESTWSWLSGKAGPTHGTGTPPASD